MEFVFRYLFTHVFTVKKGYEVEVDVFTIGSFKVALIVAFAFILFIIITLFDLVMNYTTNFIIAILIILLFVIITIWNKKWLDKQGRA